jgi:glyoxylase-like metal-dependent hydrolase (beta-lactamase superfamily II)
MTGLPRSLVFIERDWLSSNHLLGRGPEGNTLIDTGYASRRELTLALVEQALGGARLHRIINTHTHSDHVGGNAILKARHGCRIDIPVGERDAVAQWREEALHYRTLGQFCDRFDADGYLDVGDEVLVGGLHWQVVGSPGHDMDSLLLHQPEHRILVSADALWEDGFGIVFPEFFDEPGFAAQAATLDTIAALPADVVVPGHGPLFGDVPAAIARARRRLAYFVERPDRHAWLTLRVAMSFMLLDRRRLALESLEHDYGALDLVRRVDARFARWGAAELTRRVRDELVRSNVATIEGGFLLARGQAAVST